jgi:serine/threonine-protein kinase
MGTPNYVAPERLIGGPVVPATDVYGLGLLLFRVLTGRLPWPPGEPPHLSNRAELDPLPVIEGVPGTIGRLYQRCTAMNPDDRPTAREAASTLAAAVGVRPVFGDADDAEQDTGTGIGAAPADDKVQGDPAMPARYIGDVTTGEQMRALLPPFPPQRSNVIIKPHRRGRTVALAVVAVVAGLVAALILLTNLRSGEPPAFADGPRPTPTPSSGGSHGPSGGPAPVPSVGEPGTVIVTVIGTRTVTVTVPVEPGGPPATTGPGLSPSVSARRTFTYMGNSIVAECVRGTLAHIVRARPAPGYQVRLSPGPDRRAVAVFVMGTFRITMTVTCPNGVPEVEIAQS